jgi:hypothetical protein
VRSSASPPRRGRSEAEVIRAAREDHTERGRPRPRAGTFSHGSLADRVDELRREGLATRGLPGCMAQPSPKGQAPRGGTRYLRLMPGAGRKHAPRMGERGFFPDRAAELRADFRRTTPAERVVQAITLSRFATRIAVLGSRR